MRNQLLSNRSQEPLRVLVVPDKFKGTLSAIAAADAIAEGWRKCRPKDRLKLLPMSDGGDGFGEVLSRLLKAKAQRTKTMDAAHRPCTVLWWWEPKKRIAIIESARVIGLAMLPPKRFHPFDLDTFGLGAVLRAVGEQRPKRCIVGIGGSATNEGGFGLARALGWKFLDRAGREITQWSKLEQLERIATPATQSAMGADSIRLRHLTDLTVAVDVQNPLLGPRGATRVYGPQKGLRPSDFDLAESCLRRVAQLVKRQLGREIAPIPGAGAAGGLGFGLLAFAGAGLEPGFELFSQSAELESHLRHADLVITGEGAIDNSTIMGKGVGEIAHRCAHWGIPCIGLAGTLKSSAKIRRLFAQVGGLTELTTTKRAIAQPDVWLKRLSAQMATGASSMVSAHANHASM